MRRAGIIAALAIVFGLAWILSDRDSKAGDVGGHDIVAAGDDVTVPTIGPAADQEVTGIATQRFQEAPGEAPTPDSSRLPDVPELTGRIVHPGGAPVAHGSFAGSIIAALRCDDLKIKTDEDGRFRTQLSTALLGHPKPRIKLKSREISGLPAERGWTCGKAEMPGPLVNGLNDVGTIVAEPLPILVDGRVVDENGEGVGGARIFILAPETVPEWTMRGSWRSDPPEVLDVMTAIDGAFTIFSEHKSKSYGVRAEKGGLVPRSIPTVPPGTHDLIVVMARAGGLRGTIRVVPGFVIGKVRVHLSGPPVEGHSDGHIGLIPEGGRLDLTPNAAGSWGVGDLRPGRVTVTMDLEGRPPTLRRFESVAVLPGEMRADPLLQDVDLSGRIASFHLRFAGSDGKPVAAGQRICLRGTGCGGAWQEEEVQKDGTISFSSASATVDVLVFEHWHRRLVEGVANEQTIVLDPGLEVELQIEFVGEALDPGWNLAVMLQGDAADAESGPGSPRDRSRTISVAGSGPIRLTVPAPGEYVVYVTVEAGGSFPMGVPKVQPSRIKVPEGVASPIRITIPVDSIRAQVQAWTGTQKAGARD